MTNRPSAEDAALREANAQIAEDYDTFVYDPIHDPRLDLSEVLAIAALFNCNGKPADVLDLACGAGRHLEQVSPFAGGRIVGVDISPTECDLARQRFDRLGRDAEIRCADLMDLDADALGQFDLIFCIGAIYAVPPPVKAKLLDLIGRCLRPGGVAVISYYSGLLGDVAVNLRRLIRAGVDPAAGRADRLAQGRRILKEFITAATNEQADPLVLLHAHFLDREHDLGFFHEVLGGHLSSTHLLDLNDALEPYGMGLMSHLPAPSAILMSKARQRAHVLDAVDAMHGAYRFTLFAKWPGPGQSLDLARPGVSWSTSLRPAQDGGDRYKDVKSQTTATIQSAETRLLIGVLSEGPRSWAQAVAEVRATLGDEPLDEKLLRSNLMVLWQSQLVSPAID